MRFFLLICAVTVLFVQSALGQSAEGGSLEAGSVEADSQETVASGGSGESGETTGYRDNADYYGASAETGSDTSDTTKAKVTKVTKDTTKAKVTKDTTKAKVTKDTTKAKVTKDTTKAKVTKVTKVATDITKADADVGADPCEGKEDQKGDICEANKKVCKDKDNQSYPWMMQNCILTCCRVEYPKEGTGVENCNSVIFNSKQLEADKKNLMEQLAAQKREAQQKYENLEQEALLAQSTSGKAKASWWSNLDDSGQRTVKCRPTCTYLADSDANCPTYNLERCSVEGFEPFDIAVWNSFHKWKLSTKPKSCVTGCRSAYAKCETAADDSDSDDPSAAYAACESALTRCLDKKCKPVADKNVNCAEWAKKGYCRNDLFNTLDECPKSCSDLSSRPDFCSSCSNPSGYLCSLAIDDKCKADPNLAMCKKTPRFSPSFWQEYGREYQSQCKMDLCTMCQQHRKEEVNSEFKLLLDNCEIAKQVECQKNGQLAMCSTTSSVWEKNEPLLQVPQPDAQAKKTFDDYKKSRCVGSRADEKLVGAYNFNYYLDFMAFVSKMTETARLDAAMPLSTKCARSCCEQIYSSDLSVVQCCADGYKFCFGTETCVPTEEPCLVCPSDQYYCQTVGSCLPKSVSCVRKTLYDLVKYPKAALPANILLGRIGNSQCPPGKIFCASKSGKCIPELTEKCAVANVPNGYTSIGVGFCYDNGGLVIAGGAYVKKISNVAACASQCNSKLFNCDGFSFDSNKKMCRLYGPDLKRLFLASNGWTLDRETGATGKTIRVAKTSSNAAFKASSSSSLCFAKAAESSSGQASQFEIRSSNHPAYCVALTADGSKAKFETCVGGKSSQTFTFKDKKLKSLSGFCLTRSGKGASSCPDDVEITSVQAATGKSKQIKVGTGRRVRCLWGKSVSSPLKMAKCSTSSKQAEQVFLISIISSAEF